MCCLKTLLLPPIYQLEKARMRDQIRSMKNRLSCNGIDALGSESYDCRMPSVAAIICTSDHKRPSQESIGRDRMKSTTSKAKEYVKQNEFLLFSGYENNAVSYLPTYPCDTDRSSQILVRHSMPVFFYNLSGNLSCNNKCKLNKKSEFSDKELPAGS